MRARGFPASAGQPLPTTRRGFLAGCGAALGGTVALNSCGSAPLPREAHGDRPAITLAGYRFDRTAALADGQVGVEGCETRFQKAAIGDLNTAIFSGSQPYEVSEVGLHPFLLAWANEGFRDYWLLPVFPLRVFRHRSIFIRTDRGIAGPEDLRGRRVATPGFSSTSLTWLRGILQHEYGVRPEAIEWVVSTEDSSAAAAGKVSKQESVLPESLNITRGPAGADESDLLESGFVDALLHAAEPRAYVQGDPRVARLFQDYRSTERAYFAKTGIFPIMHAVAIRKDVTAEHPGLSAAVFQAYSEAKRRNQIALRKLAWASISLPWAAQELEETRALMGENFWSYGFEPNRLVLETLARYSFEQGLATRQVDVADMFHPATVALAEAGDAR